MTAPKFPDEPIRVTGDPMRNGAYFPQSGEPAADNYDAFGMDEPCSTCEGDGLINCEPGDMNCPEADDLGCVFTDAHAYPCPECSRD
jgi:hypothetical protein